MPVTRFAQSEFRTAPAALCLALALALLLVLAACGSPRADRAPSPDTDGNGSGSPGAGAGNQPTGGGMSVDAADLRAPMGWETLGSETAWFDTDVCEVRPHQRRRWRYLRFGVHKPLHVKTLTVHYRLGSETLQVEERIAADSYSDRLSLADNGEVVAIDVVYDTEGLARSGHTIVTIFGQAEPDE